MRFFLILLFLLTTAPAQAESLIHNGIRRDFIVEGSGRNTPALLVLHGGTSNAKTIRRYARLSLSQRGWTVIFPNGVDGIWNDGRVGRDGAPLRTTDDVGFLRALIDKLALEGRIDRRRVFATGISNGGAMSQRLICQAPDLIAGAVIFVMQFPVGLYCPSGPSVPMTFVLGTQDPLVPIDGGAIQTRRRDRGAVLSADETLNFYADRNRCQGVSETTINAADDGVRVRRLVYEGCAAGFQTFIMDGGGHVWPGRRVPRLLKRWLGTAVYDIDGTEIVESFVTTLAER
ncbi:MAG: hypothetical protein AAF557_17580 [Pseudomonadota bacterium]